MNDILKSISRTARCFGYYRSHRLDTRDIMGHQHGYIIKVCRHPGCLQEELAEELLVDKSNVARQLNQLELAGYVTREVDTEDRRCRRVYPTQKALDYLPRAIAVRTQWRDALLEEFTEAERETLAALMERVLHRAEKLARSEWEERQ